MTQDGSKYLNKYIVYKLALKGGRKTWRQKKDNYSYFGT